MQKLIVISLVLLALTSVAAAQPVVDYLNINADVNNGYAITTVEEKLTNPLDIATEDEFKFMIPEEAFISGFTLIIDGKEYIADVLPKQEAKEKFEQAASQGKSAGLLETKKQNMFSYSLSFAPRQSIIARLKYEQAVKKSLGEYEYAVFLSRTDQAHIVNTLSVNLNISSLNDITTLETPGFTGASVKYLSTTKGQVKYSANALPDKDLTVVYTTNNPPLNGDMLFYNTGGKGYMMHVFSPSEADLGTTALSKDIIFVVDKSGSMGGEKLAQVKRVFTGIISDLPPDDYFNVIFFDDAVRAFSPTLMEANTKNKADAANFVNSLEAGSGTNINQALLDAIAMFGKSSRVPIIVFLTDGEPTEGITSPYVIRKNVRDANKLKVSIFTIAFGIEDESNYDFLKALSLENYGKAQRFYLEGGVEEEMKNFYKTISTPLITNMSFTYNAVSDVVNTGQNNLFAGSDAIVLGKYSPGASTITSDVDAITRTGSRNFKNSFNVASMPENAFIPRLWAYTTIRKLMDRIDVEGETEPLKSGITQFSLEFKFVTPYTSLFVEVPVNNTKTAATSIDAKAETKAATAATAAATVMATQAAMKPGVTATPAAAATARSAVSTQAAYSTPDRSTSEVGKPAASPPAATSTPAPKEPGFESVFAIIGLLFLVLRKRR
ncbi:MAG: VIT domain-containing protein [Candidatus Methanoperedens sp.]|nr:VIT domain-containing protein [Candidatus Methanoperedens sp.]